MWYKVAQRMIGYKIVGFANGRAFSLYNKSITYNLAIGSVTGDTFLGTDEKFCLDYYGGVIDEPELMLTYSYEAADIISGGNSGTVGGEVRVRKAKLESYKPIPKI